MTCCGCNHAEEAMEDCVCGICCPLLLNHSFSVLSYLLLCCKTHTLTCCLILWPLLTPSCSWCYSVVPKASTHHSVWCTATRDSTISLFFFFAFFCLFLFFPPWCLTVEHSLGLPLCATSFCEFMAWERRISAVLRGFNK